MGGLELDEISYSQDETIAVICDYYDFLTKMYLPDSLVLHPPKDGWPTIQGGIPGFEKNDMVLELLRHLPYIRGEQESHGAGETLLADWQDLFTMRDYGDGLKICSEPGDYIDQPEAIPSSVIGLCYGGRDNERFLLDIDYGIIYYCESPWELEEEYFMESVRDDPTRWSNEVEAEWRQSWPAWTVRDFFNILKRQFLALVFLPINHRQVFAIWQGEDPKRFKEMAEFMRKIYWDHGWPDLEKYNKTECLAAVRAGLQEHFPEQIIFD